MISVAVLAALAPPTTGYTSRVLPSAEWPRLAGTELETLWPKLRPEDTQIVVVEQDGAIVGAWAVLRIVHVEGLWIAPAHRKQAAVGRRLLVAMTAAAKRFRAPFVWTGAETPEIAALIEKRGGYRIPWESYVLPLGGA